MYSTVTRAKLVRIMGSACLILMILLAPAGTATADTPAYPPSVRPDKIAHTTPSEPAPSIAVSINAAIVPLLAQSFATSAMPPPGWQTISYSASPRKWMTIDAAGFPDWVHAGAYAAWVNYDPDEKAQEEWLYSAPVTLPAGQTDAQLSFWAFSDTNSPLATVTLYVENDTGLHPIWDLAQEDWPDLAYRQIVLSLSAYQGQRIRLLWRYHGVSGQSFGLDEVLVSGTADYAVFVPLLLKAE